MRHTGTLWRYLLREVTLHATIGLGVITAILLSRNALRQLDELAGTGASATDAIRVLSLVAASLAIYVVPVAFLFGVLLAVGRMAADSEIFALHGCGVGLRALVLPVTVLGVLVACITGYLSFDVEHRAQRRLRLAVQTLAAEGKLVDPGAFRQVGARVIHVKRRGDGGSLEGVFIADRSDPERPLVIFAETGEIRWEPGGEALRLRLRNGDIQVEPAPALHPAATTPAANRRARRIAFRTFDYEFSAVEILGVSLSARRPREMSTSELRAVLAHAEAGKPLTGLRRQDPVYYELQLHRRLALPVAPVLFALVGVPLASRRAWSGRAVCLCLCALLGFGYYVLMSLGQVLALDAAIPALAAAWLPNAVFAAVAWPLLRRADRVSAWA